MDSSLAILTAKSPEVECNAEEVQHLLLMYDLAITWSLSQIILEQDLTKHAVHRAQCDSATFV